MATGKGTFDSCAGLGLGKHYDKNRIGGAILGAHQVIIEVSGELHKQITQLAISGGQPQVIGSGSTPPPGVAEGQIGFFENANNDDSSELDVVDSEISETEVDDKKKLDALLPADT